MYLNKVSDDNLEVLDGQQRITSFGRFVTGKFAIKDEASEGLNRACALDAKGNLYAYVICTGTPTYASGKALKMTLYFLTS